MISRRPWPAALAGALLALTACSKPAPQAAAQGEAYHKQVVDYLLQHPDVIQEAADKYEQKQHETAMAASAKAIALRRVSIEHDPRDFVANPRGKITVVEFFDYRCPYCKAAQPGLQALIGANKDVRFVFKQLPILPDADGQIGVSLRASEAALTASRQGKYLPVHDAMMAARPLDDAGIAKALNDNGIVLAKAAPDDDRHIKDIRDLAFAIGATGTPSFVVGDTLIEGSRWDQLALAIDQARKSAKG